MLSSAKHCALQLQPKQNPAPLNVVYRRSSLGKPARRPQVIAAQFNSSQPSQQPGGRLNAASTLEPATTTLKQHNQTATLVPELWAELAAEYPNVLALEDTHHGSEQLTFSQLQQAITRFGAGLHALGLREGDKVSLFSEDSWRWMVADQGIMANGAIDAVRGSTSPADELVYILNHSDSKGLIVQDAALLDKLLPLLQQSHEQTHEQSHHGNNAGNRVVDPDTIQPQQQAALKFIVVLWGEPSASVRQSLSVPVLTFDEVSKRAESQPFQRVQVQPDNLATMVFTSGTTGHPKAVMLSHQNLAYQLKNLSYYLPLLPGKRALSLLPPWHIYQRTVSYYILSKGVHLTYTNIKKFKEDLTKFPADYFVCVPLVLDTLYSRVMHTLKSASAVRRSIATFLLAASCAHVAAKRVTEGLAVEYARIPPMWTQMLAAKLTVALLEPLHRLAQLLVFKKVRTALGIKNTIVSGGGSLAPHLDVFYEALGLPVLNGWGLTETSPVLACRRNIEEGNARGTVGVPMPGTTIRVVDPETKVDLPDGVPGLILAKGPGVFSGYHKDEIATAKAFPVGDGWFDTGDLGWRAPEGVPHSKMAGMIVLTGRAKDTIVLTSGKNVEPQPLEDACTVSPYIKHMVVVGHDHRALGALVVPDLDVLEALAEQTGQPLSSDEIYKLLRKEINSALAGRPSHEHIFEIAILPQPLSVDDGTLTRTMKTRRPQIMEKYRAEVEQLLKKLR